MLKWHGGKYYLAKKIIDLFPIDCFHYVEPYFGGGAVLFAKSPDDWSEVVNDLNLELTNFWRVLQDDKMSQKLIRRLEMTPFSEVEYLLAQVPQGDQVERAVGFYIRCRQSMAGRMTAFAPLSRLRTRGGRNEQANAWISSVDSLADVYVRLRGVVILNRSALDVIREQDGPKTLFYIDPPYLPETRVSKDTYGDFEMSREDHIQLLDLVKGVKGRVLLSGYDSDLYNVTLPNWHRTELEVPNHSASGSVKKRMTEIVWRNYV